MEYTCQVTESIHWYAISDARAVLGVRTQNVQSSSGFPESILAKHRERVLLQSLKLFPKILSVHLEVW